jgi:hypothetical protein
MNGLQIISLVDPSRPELLGYCPVPAGSHGVSQNNGLAFVTGYDTTVHAIDVSDPRTPVEVGHYRLTVNGLFRLKAAGDYVYVTNNQAGLHVLQYYAAGVQQAAPEPLRLVNHGSTVVRGTLFLPEAVDRSSCVAGSLHDDAGRRVLNLKPGPNDVSHLAPGVYFVRDADGHVNAARRVVIAR